VGGDDVEVVDVAVVLQVGIGDNPATQFNNEGIEGLNVLGPQGLVQVGRGPGLDLRGESSRLATPWTAETNT